MPSDSTPAPAAARRPLLIDRAILQLLTDPLMANLTDEGEYESNLSYAEMAELLGVHAKTVNRALTSPRRGLIAQGLVQAFAETRGKQRLGTRYRVAEAAAVAGSSGNDRRNDRRLAQLLSKLRKQLKQLDEVREQTAEVIAQMEQVIG